MNADDAVAALRNLVSSGVKYLLVSHYPRVCMGMPAPRAATRLTRVMPLSFPQRFPARAPHLMRVSMVNMDSPITRELVCGVIVNGLLIDC